MTWNQFFAGVRIPQGGLGVNNNNNINKKQSQTDPDLKDQVDCVNRSLANLRSDIPEIVRDAVRKAVLDLPRISPS